MNLICYDSAWSKEVIDNIREEQYYLLDLISNVSRSIDNEELLTSIMINLRRLSESLSLTKNAFEKYVDIMDNILHNTEVEYEEELRKNSMLFQE